MNNRFSRACAVAALLLATPWGMCRLLNIDDSFGVFSGTVAMDEWQGWRLGVAILAWAMASIVAPTMLLTGIIGWFSAAVPRFVMVK